MGLVLLSALLATLTVWGGGVFKKSSPYMYEAAAPTAYWADQPMKLVVTPQFQSGKDDLMTTAATHMALLHNSIIRGYNSIYLQAAHVADADKADFIAYCKTWLRFMTSHHDDEENVLFPKIKSIFQDDDIWGSVYQEHESFLAGLGEIGKYLDSLADPKAFSHTRLVDLLESIRPDLEHHLHHEVSIIADMAKHPRLPPRNTPQAFHAISELRAWGKNTVRKAGLFDVVPFFFLNHDVTAEGGMWRHWPPMPAPIRWAMVNAVGAWHGAWWRFASCDASGKPRGLHALSTTTPAEPSASSPSQSAPLDSSEKPSAAPKETPDEL